MFTIRCTTVLNPEEIWENLRQMLKIQTFIAKFH